VEVLEENDLFFIDIGPVINGHEGDYGDTFLMLSHEQQKFDIIQATKLVFNETSKAWLDHNLSGKKLYEFTSNKAASLGYDLHPKQQGHRLGDFPYHVHYKGKLAESEKVPCENLWVLEVHLLSKDKHYGAFFEDILQKFSVR